MITILAYLLIQFKQPNMATIADVNMPKAVTYIVRGRDGGESNWPKPKEVQPKGEQPRYWSAYISRLNASKAEKEWLMRVGYCESRMNRLAKNAHSAASGLMQFMPSTYRANGGKDIWNGREQLEVALKMYRHRQSYQWQCR